MGLKMSEWAGLGKFGGGVALPGRGGARERWGPGMMDINLEGAGLWKPAWD